MLMEKLGIAAASAVYALLFAALVSTGRSDVSYVVGALVYIVIAVATILYLKVMGFQGAKNTFCITLFSLSSATALVLLGAAIFN